MDVRRCFFCDRIIVPTNLITTEEIINFFKDNNLEYTLNYTKFKAIIGKKIVCSMCETDIRIITNYAEDCGCDSCRKDREIQDVIERND